MRKILDEKTEMVKVINDGVHNLPFVISIPHSGLYITSEMCSKLKENTILANMDWYLPELYAFLKELHFTVVINNISRYVIDPNRAIGDTDYEKYTRSLIYNKTTFGKEMYDAILLQEEVDDRINRFYKNYHDTLKRTISEKLKHFDKVYLFDLHSFGKQMEKDVVLGNDNGRTINERLFNYIQKLFLDNEFRVAINEPFNGGYITKHYGDKNRQCESLQIELSYGSYIDKRVFYEEELPNINEDVMKNCQRRLQRIFSEISKIG